MSWVERSRRSLAGTAWLAALGVGSMGCTSSCQGASVLDDREVLESLCSTSREMSDDPLTQVSSACVKLGRGWVDGTWGRVDEERARHWFSRGCVFDDPVGCHNFAVLLEQGRGGPAVPEGALRAHDKACDLGNRESCLAASRLDPSGAMGRLAGPCDQGDVDACVVLGNALVDADPVTANRLWRISCEQDQLDGCYNLAVSEAKGRGMLVDTDSAKARFQRLCEAGRERACAYAERLP